MKIEKELISINDIILFLLFVACTNIANKYFYIVFFAFAIYLFFVQRVAFNMDVICLLVISLSFVLFAPWARETALTIIKPFVYPACYIMGVGLISQKHNGCEIARKEKYLRNVIVLIAMGMFAHYLLNWVTNIGEEQRNTVDFWTNEILAATNQAVMAVMILGVAVAILFSVSGVWKKILAVGVIVAVMMYNLILAGRTLIALFLLVCGIAAVYRLCAVKKKRLRFLMILFGVVAVILLCWFLDAFSVRTAIEESLLYDRFTGADSLGITDDARRENKINYLRMIWNYPFGGANLRAQVGFSHDVLFDTFDEAGIFAFIAMIVYLTSSVVRFIKCMSDKRISYNTKQLVLCVYSIVFMMFWLEPILMNASWFFAGFCVIDGCLCGLRRKNSGLVRLC